VSIADELLKLEQLRNSDSLTAAEFEDAKHALLHPAGDVPAPARPTYPVAQPTPTDNSLAAAANRYVDLQVREYNYGKIAAVVGAIIFLIVLFAVIIPAFSSVSSNNDPMFPGSVPASNFGSGCTAGPDGSIICSP
jgi:hypothetical protein